MNRGARRLSKKLAAKNAPTQAQLAAELKLDQGYISRLANGKKVPGIGARRKLYERFRIPLHLWDEPEAAEGAAA